MENGFIDKIIEEVWGKKNSIGIMLTICIIGGSLLTAKIYNQMTYLDNAGERIFEQDGYVLLAVIWTCISLLLIWYIKFVISRTYIRKAKKGKTGIILFYNTSNKTIYQDTVRKLGDEFRHKINPNFDVIDVPYGVARLQIKDKSKMVNFMNDKRSLLLLEITVNSDKDKKVLNYDLKIEGGILHPTYKDSVEKEFQEVFSKVTQKFREIVFQSKDMTKCLRITANDMSIGCEYIIGLSYFLNGQYNMTEKIFDQLSSNLQSSAKYPRMLFSVNRIRYEINMYYSTVHLEKFQFNCDNKDEIDAMNYYLEKANHCIANTYEYYLNKAYYYVIKEGDVKKATEHINICKQKKNAPATWKYSDAFIKAYSNKSIGSIVSSYKAALRVPYENIMDLTIFIESILKKILKEQVYISH